MVKILLIILVIFALYFLLVFFKDYVQRLKDKEVDNKKFFIFGITGFIANFLILLE